MDVWAFGNLTSGGREKILAVPSTSTVGHRSGVARESWPVLSRYDDAQSFRSKQNGISRLLSQDIDV